MPTVPSLTRTSTALCLAGAGSLLLAACSSDTTTSLQQACSDYVLTLFQRQATCYRVTPVPNQSTLESRNVQSCVAMSGAAGSRVDADYWETCAQAANNGCAAFKCATYPAGTRQTGEPCLASTQCASLWCKGASLIGTGGTALPGTLQCGTCAPRLTAGAACNVATDACDVGLSCFGGVCRAQGAAGAPCAVWSDCALPSVVCKSNGVCGAVTPDGQTCGNGSDCTTATGCDVTTKLCTPVQYGQPRAACDGEVHRCESGRCDKATGICPQILSDGAACDPADASKVCDAFAYCFEGTCQIPDPGKCK